MHPNWAVSKASLEKFKNYWSWISILNPTNYCIPCKHRLIGQSTKHPFEPLKPWKYKQLSGQWLDPKFLIKIENFVQIFISSGTGSIASKSVYWF